MRIVLVLNERFDDMKGYLSAMCLSIAVLQIQACSTPSTSTGDSQSLQTRSATEKLQIVTTFVPITQFTKAVAGDRATVTQLLPANVGPHDYQSKPDDVQKLAKADVLVQNGLEMEAFLENIIKNAGNGKLKTIDSSQGITPLKNEQEHDHSEAGDGAANPKKADEAHEHGEYNPHIWLDPKRAIKQVENIRDGLIAADPAGKAIYTANASTFIEQLKQLDAEITAKLKPYQGKTFVTYHDFSPYFTQSYGLKAEFLVNIPEENPSPDDVKRVIQAAKSSGLKTLLSEPQAGDNQFAALAKDLQVKVSVFDSIETALPESLEPNGYLSTMRQNAQNLEQAFSGKSNQSFRPNQFRPISIGRFSTGQLSRQVHLSV
jgi:zinc transport system substrate-binding protein